MSKNKHFSQSRPETQVVRSGEDQEFWQQSLVTPIAQTSTYTFDSVKQLLDYKEGNGQHSEYGRYANPTLAAVEQKLATLENAESAMVTSSGMAAQALAFLTILHKDAHVLITDDLYPGTSALLDTLFPRYGISYTFVPTNDPKAIEAAIQDNTCVLFTEFPTNPHLHVPDLETLAKLTQKHRLTFIVDATLCGPLICQPLQHGADLVIHSATKYLGGHNDLLAGVIAGSKPMIDAIREHNAVIGAILGPNDAFLLDRGIKTLALRTQRQSESAAEIVALLNSHPAVDCVYYPGLNKSEEPLADKYLGINRGGLVSFRPKGGQEAAISILDNMELICHAASLGGVDSMAQITHLFVTTPGTEYNLAIEPDLIRLSIGIESVSDLWQDLDRALNQTGHT